jgi:hypothetical protein
MGMMASLIAQLRAKFQSLTPLDTSTIYWETGPDGMAAHVRDLPHAGSAARPQSAESASVGTFPCKILSKSGAFYNVGKYENGIDLPTTGAAKVFVLQLNFGDTLPVGTWIMASESAMGSTGGGNVP